MTSFVLSATTQNAINLAVSSGPGLNNQNYITAYNAISADIQTNGNVNSGTANWFAQAGLINGTVDGVSRDALPSRAGNAGSGTGKPANPTADQGGTQGIDGESAYVARVSLADPSILTEQGRMSLEPGMAVTAEIKTGQRRLISYLLSPLLSYRQESMRER